MTEKINYTHRLECSHYIGTHGKKYTMRCNILGETKKSIKLEIIGERDWNCYENKRRIRYLPKAEKYRLYEVQNER